MMAETLSGHLDRECVYDGVISTSQTLLCVVIGDFEYGRAAACFGLSASRSPHIYGAFWSLAQG